MNCPVCNREYAVKLSICPGCGAMENDSVREELEVKKFRISPPKTMENKEMLQTPKQIETPIVKAKINPMPISSVQKQISEKPLEKIPTTEIRVKDTEPTLIEFQSKKSALPEWRLQVQNAVQKRFGNENVSSANGLVARTEGATALKLQPHYQIETVAETAPETAVYENKTLNDALKRIAESRQKFLFQEEIAVECAPAETVAPQKNYPFRIAAREGEILPEPKPATPNYTVKPRPAVTLKAEPKKFDTNKLPPLSEEVSDAFDIHKTSVDKETPKADLKLVETEEFIEEAEEIEDIAPVPMRFNAGLFDLIIGSFATLILLAPFMLKGGWFTFSGFLGFSAVCAVVMFVYMTVAIGFYGRTIGMRLFSLEVVDIEGENYPTIHQAAVSSSLYLVSMLFGGAGFLTIPFNEEKRAVHDIVSKTIVVKEI